MGSRVWTVSEAAMRTLSSNSIASLKSKPYSVPPLTNSPRTLITNHRTTRLERLSKKLVRVIVVEQRRTEDSNPMHVAESRDDEKVMIPRAEQRETKRRSERKTYLVAALMSSLGVSSAAIFAVYYRFHTQIQGGEFPLVEMFGTFSLAVGSAVGMEFWARWAHRAIWHASLWHMHESHHRPREGPFEVNDVFAVVNAVPAIVLLSYGLFNPGLLAGLCFGAGLGISVFGMAYMFVHDGLVHRRFAVGPIANVPYLRKVAAAHQLHHAEKFQGVPYGLFLGPKEVEAAGGMEELEKEIQRRIIKQSRS